MSQKVWVINSTKTTERATPPNTSDSSGSAASNARPRSNSNQIQTGKAAPRERWLRVLKAYLLGPFALTSRPRGRLRIAWAAGGAASVAAVVSLVVGRTHFAAWLDSVNYGLLIWIAVVSLSFLTAAVAWSRAVYTAGRDHPALATVSPRWLRLPAAVCALGLLAPGLGLLMAGYHRRAAFMLWLMGPFVLAIFVLVQWRWLWQRSRSVVPSGISSPTLEIALIVAGGVVVLGLLTWIVQALDGARRVSPRRRSNAFTDAANVALLVSLALFVTTYRPASLAQTLGGVSISLYQEGMRLIPLGFAESAARLDPTSPEYLAHAAMLNEELGMTDAARAKRELIQRRVEKYTDLVRHELQSAVLANAFSSVDDQLLERMALPGNGGTWSEIQAMVRKAPKEQ